jgi:hypothetical protein
MLQMNSAALRNQIEQRLMIQLVEVIEGHYGRRLSKENDE